MSSNIVNQIAYLRTSRNFPQEPKQLVLELGKAYIDTAQAINSRIIGIFPVNRPAITGESWYYDRNLKQQTLRQLFTFTTFAAINHLIDVATIPGFTRIFGTFTNGTNWYPLPYVDPTAANQVGVIITPTQITFVVGGSAPAITKGFIVLEWLSNF